MLAGEFPAADLEIRVGGYKGSTLEAGEKRRNHRRQWKQPQRLSDADSRGVGIALYSKRGPGPVRPVLRNTGPMITWTSSVSTDLASGCIT